MLFTIKSVRCLAYVMVAVLTAALVPTASAQVTVPFTDTSWQDFGTTNIVGVTGNFQPGWVTTVVSPDLGVNLFGNPNQTLSGAPDDAALWMLQFTSGGANNEEARLSLSGFSIGQQYELPFFATVLRQGSWLTDNDAFQVSIVGADISSFSTGILVDPVLGDGMNDWIPQTILFTATAGTVEFTFNGGSTGPDAVRFGVDGFSGVHVVPEPASLALMTFGAVFAGLRRSPSRG
jgi:PEP-CTERM motif-containing protein